MSLVCADWRERRALRDTELRCTESIAGREGSRAQGRRGPHSKARAGLLFAFPLLTSSIHTRILCCSLGIRQPTMPTAHTAQPPTNPLFPAGGVSCLMNGTRT